MNRAYRDNLAHTVRTFCLKCALNVKNLEKELNETIRLSDRELLVDYAWSWLGTWYTWGGDDPSGFDCSGLVVECGKALGLLPRGGDWTADGLLRRWKRRIVSEPSEGCLVFWVGVEGRAEHVEICYNSRFSIGASGGGRFVRSRDDAILHNAFIKLRPIESRSGRRIYVDPFKGRA